MSFFREFVRETVRKSGKVGAYFVITGSLGAVCGAPLGMLRGYRQYKKEYKMSVKDWEIFDQSMYLGSSLVVGTAIGMLGGAAIGVTAPISLPLLYITLKNKH